MTGRLCSARIRRFFLVSLAFALVFGALMGSAGRAAILVDPGAPIWYSTTAAAGTHLSCGNHARIEGALHSNDEVIITPGCTVIGDVSAVGRIDARGTVQGQVQPGAAARALPALPSEAQLRALATRTVEGNTTLTNAVVDDVLFVHGTLRIEGSLRGTGTLIASGDIRFENLPPGTPTTIDSATRLAVIAVNDIWMGKGRGLRAALRAGRDVELTQGVELEGVVMATRQLRVLEDVKLRFFDFDLQPPTISNLRPADGSTTTSLRPQVSASFSDDVSGVNGASVRILLDGVDRTGQATVGPTDVRYTPTVDLVSGSHVASVMLADNSGKSSAASWEFSVRSATPPELAFVQPPQLVVAGVPNVEVALVLTDTGSGIDTPSLRVSVDGVDMTSSCRLSGNQALCLSPPLASGSHTLAASVRNLAGIQGAAGAVFQLVLDLESPAIEITTPATADILSAESIEVAGIATDDVQVVEVQVDGIVAQRDGTRFTASIHPDPGQNDVLVVATDEIGRKGFAHASFRVDREPPTIEVDYPLPGAILNQATVRVHGSVGDDDAVARVTVDGVPALLSDQQFSGDVSLSEGPHELSFQVVDRAGNATATTVSVTRFSIPEITIDSPADLAYLATTTTDVSGHVDASTVGVDVNGISASVADGAFYAMGVPLIEGGTTITAVATNGSGHSSTATIHVVRDLTAPRVTVYAPQEREVVSTPAVTVRGLVNDIVPGTVNSPQVQVTVNGHPATVVNRTFAALDVPLAMGESSIEVEAVDASGNRGTATVSVRRVAATGPRVTIIGGNNQTGTIGETLALPLSVSVTDAAGAALSAVPVVFKVTSGDGAFPNGKRLILVDTDAAGQAASPFVLGLTAGTSSHVVEAAAVNLGTKATFAATALPAGPALIVVDSGGLQTGVAGRTLPRPLVATVIDRGSNRLSGVQVKFSRIRGGGSFPGGENEITVVTDSDGRAITGYRLGVDEGISSDAVEARVAGLEGPLAGFVASSLTAGDPTLTSVSGVVLDNTDQPVAGATLRVKDTSLVAATDVQGRFKLTGAPVGAVKLIVDGSTISRPGTWPDLEYDVVTVPGRDVTVNMPIYLLPLDLGTGTYVDETHGGVLRLPDFPGFGLEVAAGSVTFPSGSRSGTISATVVHNDKVPMTPNFGQQPRFIVTIQPAGARFDPPARLTLPNMDGLPPGAVTEMYSFDHDLGHFISIGPATVTADGTQVTSLPGVGVVKAGWHCGGDPDPTGATHACPQCQICNGVTCAVACPRPDATAAELANKVSLCELTCTDNDPCTHDVCDGMGSCSHQKYRLGAMTISTPDHFQISAVPRMPRIMADVEFTPEPVPPGAVFFWDTTIRWTSPTAREIGLDIPRDVTLAPHYQPNFPSIRGGTLRIEVDFHVDGKLCDQSWGQSYIRGLNPPHADINAALPDDDARHIACHESGPAPLGPRQFGTQRAIGPGEAGDPLMSVDLVGVGVMQVTNPAPSDNAYWNWRQNVQEGVAILADKEREAAGFPARQRAAGHPGATDFTADELRREKIQRYNSGSYWRWNDLLARWEADPPNDYVNQVLNCVIP